MGPIINHLSVDGRDANLLGVSFASRLELLLEALHAEFLVLERLLELETTVADRRQLTAGGVQSLFHSVVFTPQLRHLLLVSAADEQRAKA